MQKLLLKHSLRNADSSIMPATASAKHLRPIRIALSYEFVEERRGQEYGDVWLWDLDDRSHPTVEWLGEMSQAAAKIYAKSHNLPFYGRFD